MQAVILAKSIRVWISWRYRMDIGSALQAETVTRLLSGPVSRIRTAVRSQTRTRHKKTKHWVLLLIMAQSGRPALPLPCKNMEREFGYVKRSANVCSIFNHLPVALSIKRNFAFQCRKCHCHLRHFGQFSVQLLDVDVLKPQFAQRAILLRMALQLDRAFFWQRLASLPNVFQRHLIDYKFAVQVHSYLIALHDDAEGVPFARRLVCPLEGHIILLVIPQAAGAFLVILGEFLGIERVGIPYLHLRVSTQIHAAVAFGFDFPVEQKLDVAVIFDRGEVVTLTIVHQDAALGLPMRQDILVGRFLCRL